MKKNITKLSLFITSLALIAGFTVSFNNDFSSAANAVSDYLPGSGSMYDPYLISNLDDYNTFAKWINEDRYAASYAGKYFKLTNDIGDKDNPITQIVGISPTYRFAGLFEGNNHKLYVDIKSDNQYVGVFGYVGVGDTIYEKNPPYIRAFTVEGNIESGANSSYVGGIVGEADCQLLYNCYNHAEIKVNPSSKDLSVGGVCGYARRTTRITNCSNFGEISCNDNFTKDITVGGICGALRSIVYNSSNYGDIKNGDLKANDFVGGAIGTLSSTDGIIATLQSVLVAADSDFVYRDMKIDEHFFKNYNFGFICGKVVETSLDTPTINWASSCFVSDNIKNNAFSYGTIVKEGGVDPLIVSLNAADTLTAKKPINDSTSLVYQLNMYNMISSQRADFSTWQINNELSDYPTIEDILMRAKIAFSYNYPNKENDFRIIIGISKEATIHHTQYSGNHGGIFVKKNNTEVLRLDFKDQKAYQYYQGPELDYFVYDNDPNYLYITINLGDLLKDNSNAMTVFNVERYSAKPNTKGDSLPELLGISFKSLLDKYLEASNPYGCTQDQLASLRQCKSDLGL